MAQPTLTLNGTDHADGSTTTGWTSPAELGTLNMAMDVAVQTEFFIQGANALGIAERNGGAVIGIRFAITSTDYTVGNIKAQVYLWVTSNSIMATLANGGVRVYAADSDGDFAFWYVGGGAGETSWVGNGWKLVAWDVSEPPDEQGGGGDALFDPTICTFLGAAIFPSTGLGKADMFAVDQLRTVTSIEVTGNTLRFTDGTGIELNENGASEDTIVRSGGSWITDGFENGDTIEVRNATESANDGLYTITAVPTASTLTIGIGDLTTTNGSDTSVEIEAEFTIQDIITEDTTTNDTYYGAFSNGDTGSIEMVGNIIIGDVSGATYTSFRTTNEIIVIPDNNLTSGMSEITVAEDTGQTRVKFGFSSGTGDGEIGFAGSTFYAAPEVYNLKYRMDFSPNITECLIFGSTFQNLEENGFLMGTAATDNRLKSCNFLTSGQIQTSNAIVRKCFFIGTTSADAALLWDSTNQDIAECQFLANTDATNDPAGIEHDDLGTPYAYVDLVFAGNDNDVFLPYPFGDITINAGGTSNPVIEREPGPGLITIVNTKSINFHVDDADGNIVGSAQVYIQKATPTAQFSGAGNTAGSATLVLSSTLDGDIPTSGWVIVLDKSENATLPYRYESVNGAILTLISTAATGITSSQGTNTQLFDTSKNFLTDGVFAEGDTIRNTTDGSWAVIDQIISATELFTTPLRGGTNNTWGTGGDPTHSYSVHDLATSLEQNIDTVDIPLVNEQTDSITGDTPVVSFNFGSSFSAIIRIRANEGTTKFIPFLTTVTISGDFSGSAVIQEDVVVI